MNLVISSLFSTHSSYEYKHDNPDEFTVCNGILAQTIDIFPEGSLLHKVEAIDIGEEGVIQLRIQIKEGDPFIIRTFNCEMEFILRDNPKSPKPIIKDSEKINSASGLSLFE